jgi:hypothetical protein
MTAADPVGPVARQLVAYNARDLARFTAEFADDVTVYRLPATEPVLRGRDALAAYYAEHRFSLPDLRAEVLQRLVVGTKVVDHERLHGVRPEPYEIVAVYDVRDARIRAVWFHAAD